MVVYFLMIFGLVLFEGKAFLALSYGKRLVVGIGAFIPFAVWIVLSNLLR